MCCLFRHLFKSILALPLPLPFLIHLFTYLLCFLRFDIISTFVVLWLSSICVGSPSIPPYSFYRSIMHLHNDHDDCPLFAMFSDTILIALTFHHFYHLFRLWFSSWIVNLRLGNWYEYCWVQNIYNDDHNFSIQQYSFELFNYSSRSCYQSMITFLVEFRHKSDS